MLVCAISWEQRKLSEISEKVSKKNQDMVVDEVFTNSAEFGIISQRDYFDKDIANSENIDGYYIVEPNDFVYNPRISTLAPFGPVRRNKLDKSGAMSPLYYVFRTHNVDCGYLEYFFKTNRWHSFMHLNGNSGARSDRFAIRDEVFRDMPISMPQDIVEQKKVGDFFSTLELSITLHQREYFLFDFSGESAKTAQNTLSWEQRKVGELTVESSEYTTLEAGFPLLTSSRNGLMYQNEYRGKQTTDSTETMFSIVPLGACTYRHMSDDDVFHLNVNRLEKGLVSREYPVFYASDDNNLDFIVQQINSSAEFRSFCAEQKKGGTRTRLYYKNLCEFQMLIPNTEEQEKIATFLLTLDTLITLHQREPPKEDKILNDIKTDTLFHEYYCQWLVIYKEGSVRGVTMQKYHLTAEWVKKLIPDVKLCDFDRITYQQLINDYAETHERQTTMDFHHQLKGAILDAVDDGLIARDPTRKVIIKGKSPNDKKKKYLSRYELQKLLTNLDLNSGLNMDWLILLIAKTGMRFSEAIAVTPVDFDFTHQTLSVNKTWDYKGEGGFQPTKNKSSVRKIRLDWQTVGQFYAIVRELNDTAPIFVSKEKKIYNSTLNDVLERHCKAVGIPTISVHGLRHTHASLLLFDGVSIASVAQRLGHSSINTTQKTYLHIIRELENKDIDLIMKSISSLLD